MIHKIQELFGQTRGQIRAGIVDVTERALQGAFNEPIPVKIRTFGDREKQYR